MADNVTLYIILDMVCKDLTTNICPLIQIYYEAGVEDSTILFFSTTRSARFARAIAGKAANFDHSSLIYP